MVVATKLQPRVVDPWAHKRLDRWLPLIIVYDAPFPALAEATRDSAYANLWRGI